MENYKCINPSNNKVVNIPIINDDTIRDIYEKISLQIKNKNIYMWCKSNIINKNDAIETFIDDCFSTKMFVSLEHLNNCLFNTFGLNTNDNPKLKVSQTIDKNHAFYICKNINIKFRYTSLQSKYFQNDTTYALNYAINPVQENKYDNDEIDSLEFDFKSTLSKTIEHFQPINKEIYFIDDTYDTKNKNIYFNNVHDSDFEFITEKTNDIAKIFKKIGDNNLTKNSNIYENTSITSISFRLNENDNLLDNVLNIASIFQEFVPSNMCPFAKYVSPTGNLFKLIKEKNGVNIINKQVLEKWADIKVGNNIREYILFKIFLEKYNKFASLIVYPSSIIDIYLNFGIAIAPKKKEISDLFPLLNKFVIDVHFESKLIDNNIWDFPTTTSYIIKYSCIGMIEDSKKMYKVETLKAIVENDLSNYFNVIKTVGNRLTLVYKRSDDFSNDAQISRFIKRYQNMQKKSLIVKMSRYFSISGKTALDFYNKYSKKNSENIYIPFWNNKYFSLTIVSNINGYLFLIEGINKYVYQKRIIALIKLIITSKEKTKTKTKFNEEISDSFNDNEHIEDDEYIDDIDNLDFNEEEEDYLKQFEEYVNQNSENNLPENDKTSSDSDDDEVDVDSQKNNYNKFILKSLLKADINMFKPNGISQGKYAKSCQMTIKRQPRQPVVVTNEELKDIIKNHPKSINNSLPYGSTPELTKKNNYICPQVWCPKSRSALSKEEFEKAGEKCPNPNDFPIVYYKSEYFKNGNVFAKVMKLKDKDTSFEFCAPCCYARELKHGDNSCDIKNNIDSRKYIVKENTIPLDENRFGLLPLELSKLFGNDSKNCGDRHDGTGHMNSSTNAILRYGIQNVTQSFIECMIFSLNNKNIANYKGFVKAVVDNIHMETYITLSNGSLCRAFINDSNDIRNHNKYTEFRKWFISDKRKKYIESFNLKSTYNHVYNNKKYDGNDQHTLREFTLYFSFKNFLSYIKDDSIAKTHDVLFHMFNENLEWLNPSKINFILFETIGDKIGIYCDPYNNQKNVYKPYNPTAFIIKQGVYYEPIIRANIVGSSVNITRLFEQNNMINRVNKVIRYFVNKCTSDLSKQNEDAINIIDLLNTDINTFVIDYNLRCIGIIISKDLYIPFQKPAFIMSLIKSDFANARYMFIDSMYAKINPKFDIQYIETKIKDINEKMKKDYIKINDSNEDFFVTNYKAIILFKKLSIKNDFIINEIESDLHIFNNWILKDERIQMIDKLNAIDNMNDAIFKELIYLVNKDNNIKKELNLLRYDNVSLTKTQKSKILFSKIKDYMPRVMVLDFQNNLKGYKKKRETNKSCSHIGKKHLCIAPCSLVKVGKNEPSDGLFCRLKVPKDMFKSILANALYKLVDPNVDINLSYSSKNKNYNNATEYYTFSSEDIKNENFIGKLVDDTSTPKDKQLIDFDRSEFDSTLDSNFRGMDDSSSYIDIQNLKKIHTDYRSKFKNFVLCGIEKYEIITLYKFFANVYNQTQKKQITYERLFADVNKEILILLQENNKEAINLLKIIPLFAQIEKFDIDNFKNIEILLKDIYPSVIHLYVLSKIINMNILVFGRIKKPHYNQSLRCIDPVSSKNNNKNGYILLNQSNMGNYDKFEIVAKDISSKNSNEKDLKYIFNSTDFIPEVLKEIENRCILVSKIL